MKVLSFGSLNSDHVYKLPHIVKEGETISSTSFEIFCGGKGLNQSISLKKAGADVYHAGCIGNDGLFLVEKLKEYGINTDNVKVLDVPTGHAIIQVDENGQNSIFLFGGANQSNTKEFMDEVLDKFQKDDYIVLQNEVNNLDYLIDQAYQKGLNVVLNPSPFDEKISKCDLSKVSVLFINEVEGNQITGKTEPEEIVKEILGIYPDLKIVLTLGSQGAVYADKQTYLYQQALGSVVKDTTAAGDTFSGYFMAGLTEGMDPKDALLLASKASAITISKIGAADSIPYRDDLTD